MLAQGGVKLDGEPVANGSLDVDAADARRQGAAAGQAPVRARARALRRPGVAVHGGLLRLDTPGNGHIVDLTRGVASVVAGVRRRARARHGVRDRLDGRGDDDGVRAGRRPRPPAAAGPADSARGDYEHNRLNHDTNAHAHLRAALIGPSETIPIVDGELVLGHLAADRADRLRRPAPQSDRDRPGALLRRRRRSFSRRRPCWLRPAQSRRPRGAAAFQRGRRFGAILIGPLRDPSGSRARPEKETPSPRGATVFENSTACAPLDRSLGRGVCPGSTPSPSKPVFGSLGRRCQN